MIPLRSEFWSEKRGGHEIVIGSWKRRTHFEFFGNFDYPQYSVSFNIDITTFIKDIKERKGPFYYLMIYCSTYCANQIEEFKYRNRNGKVILHDVVNPSFTDLDGDSDLFKIVTVDMKDNVNDFIAEARNKSENQKEYFPSDAEEQRDDLIYLTSIPWISYTQLSHPIVATKKDSVPGLSWGKYFKENERVLLPYSVQLNHCFADAIHVAQFKELLERLLEKGTDLFNCP